MGAGAFPVNIETAAVEFLALIPLVSLCIACRVRHGQPEAGWLIGFHALSSHAWIKELAGPQGDVSQDFSIEAITGAAAKEPVFWIDEIESTCRTLFECFARHHEPEHVFEIPTGILLDRFGPRATMSGLLLLAVAGAFLFANASSTNELFAGRAHLGSQAERLRR